MKPSLLFAAAFAVIAPSCAVPGKPGAPAPSTPADSRDAARHNGKAPGSIAGRKLRYTDNHSRNTYTFLGEGGYRFDYVHHSGTDTGGREGRYRYSVTSPDNARIKFDDGDAITLHFTDPLNATGTLDGDLRIYRFRLTRPAGE